MESKRARKAVDLIVVNVAPLLGASPELPRVVSNSQVLPACDANSPFRDRRRLSVIALVGSIATWVKPFQPRLERLESQMPRYGIWLGSKRNVIRSSPRTSAAHAHESRVAARRLRPSKSRSGLRSVRVVRVTRPLCEIRIQLSIDLFDSIFKSCDLVSLRRNGGLQCLSTPPPPCACSCFWCCRRMRCPRRPSLRRLSGSKPWRDR